MSEDRPHPISLEAMFFTHCEVASVPNHEPKADSPPLDHVNNITVAPLEGEKGRYTVHMSTLINPHGDPAHPYKIRMECLGVFHADDTLQPEEAQRGVHITGHSVLYGAIRESVAWLTGRQPYGPLLLGLSVLRGRSADAAKTE